MWDGASVSVEQKVISRGGECFCNYLFFFDVKHEGGQASFRTTVVSSRYMSNGLGVLFYSRKRDGAKEMAGTSVVQDDEVRCKVDDPSCSLAA